MRILTLCCIASAIVFLGVACSGGKSNPINSELTAATEKVSGQQGNTHLWGFYDVHIDLQTQTATAVINRNVMFAANVVNFLNSSAGSLSFVIHDTPTDPGGAYVDVDIDVSLRHPFPGMPQYNGYDVRGIFIGNGSKLMAYNPDLKYAKYESTDQVMYDYNKTNPAKDPYTGLVGMPDGYTRWWNAVEFANPSMPLFGYTQGVAATPGYKPTATLNPYKYFADDLTPNGNLWSFITTTTKRGVFSSGKQNTRNYYLRFPNPNPGIKFAYAVVANWKGDKPEDHPANAPEAVALSVTVKPDLYYVDPGNKGGKLILDISVFDWDSTIVGGKMEDYKLIIESTVLSTPAWFSSMTPTGGGVNYSTYHVEIPADNITGITGNEFFVIVEDQKNDYTNPYGVSNQAGTDKLAACFRYDLAVASQPFNNPPVITGVTDDIPPTGLNEIVTSLDTSVTYSVQFTDPDPGQTHTISWYIEVGTATEPSDPPDSMPYNWGTKTTGTYKLWVKVNDGFVTVTGGPYDLKRVAGWAQTWGSTGWDLAYATAVDNSGNIYVTGTFNGTVDFDPGPGVSNQTSKGTDDAFLSKFNANGFFQWVRTWGGSSYDEGFGVATDSTGNIYVTGWFSGTVDFNPGTGVFNLTSNGWEDAYLTKFDTNGNFIWAGSWGSDEDWDAGLSVAVDTSNNVFVTGFYSETTVDFDPGPGTSNRTSAGWEDIYISKFNSSCVFQWVRDWGYDDTDAGTSVTTDGSGAAYITGWVYRTTATDSEDVFLRKYSATGTLNWSRVWGGDWEDYGRGVVADSSGNVYVTGDFWETVDFNPGTGEDWRTAIDWSDAFLSKFDTNGTYLWARTWGGDDEDFGNSVVLHGTNTVYVTGDFWETADFNPGAGVENRTSKGIEDGYLLRLDSNGNYQWVCTWGGTSSDFAKSVKVNSSTGDVFVVGSFSQTCDFHPGPELFNRTSSGLEDAYLWKVPSTGSW